MQKINYTEKITIESPIKELLLINIDDKLTQSIESDCIKISGTINISGEVSTQTTNVAFNHPIEVDILLSKEQLIDEQVTITVDDFNYQIKENLLTIDLIIKIDGLKEIEPYFLAEDNQEIIEVDDNELNEERISENTTSETIINNSEDEYNLNDIENDNGPIHHSLLNQIFRNKKKKTESTYLFHVVKEETSYQEIASLYDVNEDTLKSINNNCQIYIGKLILIPRNKWKI